MHPNPTIADASPPWALRRIVVGAADVGAQHRFYERVLGLPVRTTDGGGCETTVGASRLEFAPVAPGDAPFHHFAFNIPPARFEEAVRWLEARARLLPDGDGNVRIRFDAWDADGVFFHDPAGNIVELIGRRTMDIAPSDGAFGPRDLTCVSEIGIVTDDPPDAAAAITNATGAPVYGEPSDDFTALGNEHGLFILSRTGRPWAPTRDRPGEPHPTRINVAGPIDGRIRLDDGPVEIR